MTPYTAIIVDDEAHAIFSLSKYVEKTPNLHLSGTYENPLEALNVLTGPTPPDIAFLDIDMPELSGIALAALTERNTQVIFVSAHSQFALDAYGVHAVGYLLKPFSFETFIKTVKHVCAKIDRSSKPTSIDPLLFKTSIKGKYITVLSKEIIYIEAMGNYMKIYTKNSDSPIVVYLSLKQAVLKFTDSTMIRISRSFLINTLYVNAIDGNRIKMNDEKYIIVGPTYRSSFQQYVSTHLVGEN